MVNRKVVKISALISGFSGLVILIASFWPILQYQLDNADNYGTLLSPLSSVNLDRDPKILDYTKASNWFPEGGQGQNFNSSKVSFYNISIPKLKNNNATVAIGGEDLSKNLVQYPGTALPGNVGNSVIFGHSILPIFFDPKNYMSIFSTLPSLKEGDEIDINFDGILYKYSVENLFEVLPSDIQVLEQDESDSFLTLVTCVPPGDPRKPKRLIVRARIIPYEVVYNTNLK